LTNSLDITKLQMNPEVNSYTLEFVTSENHLRRGVLFLVSNDKKVTAHNAFTKFRDPIERTFQTRFDAWVNGIDIIHKPGWYHGWDMSEFGGRFTDCFVFKCKDNRKERRLYGFLQNPKASKGRYQVCILVNHAFKNQHETHIQNLKNVEKFRTLPAVQRAIRDFFREKANDHSLDRTKH